MEYFNIEVLKHAVQLKFYQDILNQSTRSSIVKPNQIEQVKLSLQENYSCFWLTDENYCYRETTLVFGCYSLIYLHLKVYK